MNERLHSLAVKESVPDRRHPRTSDPGARRQRGIMLADRRSRRRLCQFQRAHRTAEESPKNRWLNRFFSARRLIAAPHYARKQWFAGS